MEYYPNINEELDELVKRKLTSHTIIYEKIIFKN